MATWQRGRLTELIMFTWKFEVQSLSTFVSGTFFVRD
jgi:hypothetical protein